MSNTRWIQLDDSFTKSAIETDKKKLLSIKGKRQAWITEIEEMQEEENKKWFKAVHFSKFYLPTYFEQQDVEEFVFKTDLFMVWQPILVAAIASFIGIPGILFAVVILFFCIFNYDRLKTEDWRFSVSKQGFKIKSNDIVKEISFDNTLLLTFRSVGNGKHTQYFFSIYYALPNADTYEREDIEYKELADNKSAITRKVGYFWQKHLDSNIWRNNISKMSV